MREEELFKKICTPTLHKATVKVLGKRDEIWRKKRSFLTLAGLVTNYLTGCHCSPRSSHPEKGVIGVPLLAIGALLLAVAFCYPDDSKKVCFFFYFKSWLFRSTTTSPSSGIMSSWTKSLFVPETRLWLTSTILTNENNSVIFNKL